MADESEIMTVAEVASFLQMGESTVYRHIYAGKIPVIRLGGLLRVRRTRLLEHLDLLTELQTKPRETWVNRGRRRGKP